MSKEINEAVTLLRDQNLVWSNEFENIRIELAVLLEVCQSNPAFAILADNLAKRLISDEPLDWRALETRDA